MAPISLLHGKGSTLILMKILTFLMYGDLHFTGCDPTMILDSSKIVKAIIVNGHTYEVVHLIYTLQSLIGHGTTIWLVFVIVILHSEGFMDSGVLCGIRDFPPQEAEA